MGRGLSSLSIGLAEKATETATGRLQRRGISVPTKALDASSWEISTLPAGVAVGNGCAHVEYQANSMRTAGEHRHYGFFEQSPAAVALTDDHEFLRKSSPTTNQSHSASTTKACTAPETSPLPFAEWLTRSDTCSRARGRNRESMAVSSCRGGTVRLRHAPRLHACTCRVPRQTF